MPQKPLTDEQLLETLRLYSEYGSVKEAARMANNGAGINRHTFQTRLSTARDKFGDGETLAKNLENLAAKGYEVPAYSHLTKTIHGEPIWIKAKKAEMEKKIQVLKAESEEYLKKVEQVRKAEVKAKEEKKALEKK